MNPNVPTLLVIGLTFLAEFAPQDDLRREKGPTRPQKNALEGRPPPELRVENWLNSEPLRLAELRGKVVVLDFWGVW